MRSPLARLTDFSGSNELKWKNSGPCLLALGRKTLDGPCSEGQLKCSNACQCIAVETTPFDSFKRHAVILQDENADFDTAVKTDCTSCLLWKRRKDTTQVSKNMHLSCIINIFIIREDGRQVEFAAFISCHLTGEHLACVYSTLIFFLFWGRGGGGSPLSNSTSNTKRNPHIWPIHSKSFEENKSGNHSGEAQTSHLHIYLYIM